MKALAALANGAWLASSLPAWLRFRRALDRPEETQRAILRRLLGENAGSAYGRAHRFAEIQSYEQFRERVPLVKYEDLEPWIARIRGGEASVLTREPVTRLVPTSGSTSARKLIPFTAGLQREINAAVAPWITDLCRAHPDVPLGPAYWSISPAIPADTREESAVPIGFDDDSAYLGGIRKRLVEAALAVPLSVRLTTDLSSFRYATLLCLLRQPALTLISVWHPSFLTLLLDALPECWEECLRHVENGGCRSGLDLHARPQPARAEELHRIGPMDPHAIWPRLRVVSCWADAQAALACADLQRRLPRIAIQPKGLLATEAFVSIPFRGRHPVAITSHFFEFLDESGAARLARELRPGVQYSVVVTTAGGLWRCRLGDIVEVDGRVGSTPSLRFLGRGWSISDVCGEKLSEAFVTRAIAAACADAGIAPAFAALAPECNAGGLWHYTLLVEDAPPELLLLTRLETGLRANPHYALCRDLGQLGPLRCRPLARDAYERLCEDGMAAGRRLGDIKPRALITRKSALDGWLRGIDRSNPSA